MTKEEQLTERVTELEVALDNMRNFNVRQRVICEVLKQAQRHDLNPARHDLKFTKTVLALRVGIENETLSRAIHGLPEYGVSINGKTVTMPDRALTMRKVCEQCAGRWTCKATLYQKETRQA